MADTLVSKGCFCCAGKGTITRVIPPAEIPCQSCRREDYEAFMEADHRVRKGGQLQ